MRILQIHNFYRLPGGECSVVRAEKALLESGAHDVALFSADSNEIASWSVLEKAVSYAQIPFNWQVRRKLLRLVDSFRPEVAHVHNVFPLLSPSVYYTLYAVGVPVVQTIHNFRFICPNGQFFVKGNVCEACAQKGLMSAVWNRCMRNSVSTSALYAGAIALAWRTRSIPWAIDRYIALNKFFAHKLSDAGVPESRVRICGNYVDTITNEPSSKGGYVLYLGRLSPEKGIETLLDAWSDVKDGRLIIAGTGPLEGVVRRRTAVQEDGRIEYVGFVSGPEKTRLIERASCLVVPSQWYENFPLSVAEALGLGTAVVASHIGGLPDLVEDGRNGLLVEPGNVQSLSKALQRILASDELALEFGANAQRSAKQRLGATQHASRLLEIYTEAIEHRRSGTI